jgi:outer membrane protein
LTLKGGLAATGEFMRQKSSALALSVAMALFAGPSPAENLVDVYQAAVQNDPLIREAEARRMAALEAKPQARALLFPQISVGGQVNTAESDSKSFFPQVDPTTGDVIPVGNKNSTDTDLYWDYTAQLTQTVFRWDQWQQLKRSDSQVALAEANYRAAQQDLLVRVAQRYFDVLAAEDTLGAAEATLESVNRQLEQAEKRFEVGLIAITDVQEARAAHDSATAGVIAAKRSLASTHEALRELTGEAYQVLVKPAEDMPLDQPQPADEEQWVDQALEQNLNVIAARLGVDIAKSNVKIAQGGYMPTVDLFAQRFENDRDAEQVNKRIVQVDNPTIPPGEPVAGSADASRTDDVIGLRVNIPIYTGGATRSRVREQVYLHRAERERLEGALRQAERETRDAYLGVLAERARVQALQQSVKSNQTALEATEAGFEVGTRTTVDVLLARQRLFEAQRDYARSRYDYLINLVRLKSAAGVLAPQDLSSINAFLTTPTPLPAVRKPAG